jgi:outer membrane protein, multidrug efflux system
MYRRETEAARANLRATEWAQQTIYSTLVQNVASSYYQLRTLDAELEITRQTLAARKQSLALTHTLEEGDNTSLADVRQAEQLYYTAEAAIPNLQSQIKQQENSLALLLGRDPEPIERGKNMAEKDIADAPHPADVPVGLPSGLLERRPGVRRAEQLLVQANANIGVARGSTFLSSRYREQAASPAANSLESSPPRTPTTMPSATQANQSSMPERFAIIIASHRPSIRSCSTRISRP